MQPDHGKAPNIFVGYFDTRLSGTVVQIYLGIISQHDVVPLLYVPTLCSTYRFCFFLLGHLAILGKTPQMSSGNIIRRIHGPGKFAPGCALRDSRD